MSLTLRRLLAPAALLLLAWLGIMLSGPLQERPVAFVSLYALAFGAYAWAAWIVLRAGASERRLLIAVVAVGALARVIALPGAPSDDIHRYLWEAKVQRAGLDPYALAPDAPELAALAADDPDHPRVNHPSWTAIYPPGAQLWNRLVGRGVLALKLSYLVAEALALIALFFLLRARSLPASRALIYWWNPLPILAFAVEGHLDALTVAALTAALAALELSRTRTGAALLGAAALAKGLAVAVVPAYLRSVPPQRWLFAAAIGLAAWLPFRGAGTDISASLLRFGGELSYNDSLHEVASVVLATAGATAPAASRLVVAGLWLALAALVVLREHADPLRGA
ncbi:MAG: hypothetical protein OEO21_13215, partial [Candidatus Krumholzibacteria bacterium]|nr:hypothetical protein [Candidatus Krumholzibacteria bacterium]